MVNLRRRSRPSSPSRSCRPSVVVPVSSVDPASVGGGGGGGGGLLASGFLAASVPPASGVDVGGVVEVGVVSVEAADGVAASPWLVTKRSEGASPMPSSTPPSMAAVIAASDRRLRS